MARRSQLFTLMPWAGGINDSADPGAIPVTDLVTADNILYTTAGARIKRPGMEYIDDLAIPAAATDGVSLTSNVVTITFASSINDGTNNIFVAGEKITVSCNNTGVNVTDVAITTASGTSITYPKTNADIGVFTPTSLTITRTSKTVGIHDFWYFDAASNAKQQLKMMLTSQGKLFKFDSNGDRLEVTKATANVTATSASPAVFTLASHGFQTGTAISFSSLTGGTGLSVDTVYYTEYIDANTFYLSESRGGSRVNTSSALTASTMSTPFALTLPITACDMQTFNERLFVTADGIKNHPIIFDPSGSTYTYVKNAMPNASIMGQHEGRLLANDKTNPDYLHYSAPGDHTQWNGYGDSGVMEIGPGDGDPSGITAILPPFKGVLFVSKSERLYRLPDPGVPLSRIEAVSKGIGVVSHSGVAPVDMDDVLFISKRGFHSLSATNTYGDFSGAFVSDKIQNAFQDFTATRRSLTWGKYFSKYNSVLFTVAESSASAQDSIYAYNIKAKEWYRWPDVDMQCVTTAKVGANEQLIFGTSDSRLMSLNPATFTDEHVTNGAYAYRVKTGKIYVDGNPNTVKAFKRIGLIFKPQGTFQFDVNIKIDNLPRQSVPFSKTTSGDLLGSTFTLGQSSLSYESTLDPFSLPIEGYGRGIEVEIVNNSDDQQVTIYGLNIEYVPAGVAQETYISGDATE